MIDSPELKGVMISNLYWLTGEQMERLKPFFPKSHGKPRINDQRVLSGIIFINRNGLRRCDAPREYGLPKTLDTCCRAIFSERLEPGLTGPHARRTARLQGLIRHLALALGGRAAQARGQQLMLTVSKDTFLWSLCPPDDGSMAAARVIGIDDWAWRKGQRYGTLICDLERRRVIDLLPDREPARVEAWLRAHPQVEMVARDRNGGYGSAIAKALPRVVQVAERWHLLESASAAFLSGMPAIRKAIGNTGLDPKLLTAAEWLQYEGFRRGQKTNEMVRHMAKDRTPIKQIVRRTGLSRKLVRQILRGEREDVFRTRESSLTPWLVRLEAEWSAGCRNGAEPWLRLRACGFRGSLSG